MYHNPKTFNKWFADHCITLFDWPVTSPVLNSRRIYEMLSRERWEKYRLAEGPYQVSLGLNNNSAVSQADCLHVMPLVQTDPHSYYSGLRSSSSIHPSSIVMLGHLLWSTNGFKCLVGEAAVVTARAVCPMWHHREPIVEKALLISV